MKKTLLAAALALGFAGVAQAETSVTLYGVIDTGIGYSKVETPAGDAKKFGLVNGVQAGSRFGLRGTEDLGNGLQAVFQLEAGFDSSTGHQSQGGRIFGRHATIGLQSDAWGRLDLGRQTNIASKYFADVASPFGASFGQANAGATFGSANTVRWDNMVMYQTPNFSGFQFGVGYSFNTNNTQDWKYDGLDEDNDKGLTTGLRYANGPLAVALTYDQVKNDANVGAQDVTVKAWNIGASYDFEVVKLHLAYGQTRDGWIGAYDFGGGASAANLYLDDYKANLYTVGLGVPLAGGRLAASWAMADIKDLGPIDFEKQQIYSLGYTYPLSKRTNIYSYASYAKNLYGVDDTKSTVFGVGVRHQF